MDRRAESQIQLMPRPVNFECPWCGPHGVPVDHTLPIYLRLCDACLPHPLMDSAPPQPADAACVTDLREMLHRHVAEWDRPWPGAEFGKAIIGRAILGALRVHGADPAHELQSALVAVGRHR